MTRYHPLLAVNLYDALAFVGAVVLAGALVAFVIMCITGPPSDMDPNGG